MRKVTIKNLYSSLSSNLERLPFAVTKHGKVIAEVNEPGSRVSLDNLPRKRVDIANIGKSLDVSGVSSKTIPNPRKDINALPFTPYSKAQQVGKK